MFLKQTAETERASCKYKKQLQAVIHFIGKWNFNGPFRVCIIPVKLISGFHRAFLQSITFIVRLMPSVI